MAFPPNPTWDNNSESWDSDPLKTWDDYYSDSINSQIQPNIGIEIWSGFSNENILIGKFNVDTIALNTVDRTVKFSGRDAVKALISNVLSTSLFKNIKNELAIEYLANLVNISSSLTDLNSTGGVISYLCPQDQQAWDLSQQLGEAVGLSSLYVDAKGVLKMRTMTQSEGLMHFWNSSLTAPAKGAYGGSIANGFYWQFYYDNNYGAPHNSRLIKFDFYTQETTYSELSYAGQTGFPFQNMYYCNGSYYFSEDGQYAGGVRKLLKFDGVTTATIKSSDFEVKFVYGTDVYGITSAGHLIKYDTVADSATDLGIPTDGGNNYSVSSVYYDNGKITVKGENVGLQLSKIFTYSGGVFTLVDTFATYAGVQGGVDTGSGIYWVINGAIAGVSNHRVYKLYNGVLTLEFSENWQTSISNTSSWAQFYGGLSYVKGQLIFWGYVYTAPTVTTPSVIAYNIAAPGFTFQGYTPADGLISGGSLGDLCIFTMSLSGNVYLFSPGVLSSLTPNFLFSYDGTLISLQTGLTDAIGGDNAILNDVEVKSDTQSLAASATVYEHKDLPFPVLANQTIVLQVELTTPCDLTLVLTCTASGAKTSTITQHPFKPTITITAGAADINVTALSIAGEEIVTIGTLRAEVVDIPANLYLYGKRKYSLQNNYITGANMPLIIATGILNKYKTPTSTIDTMDVCYSPNIEIEDVVLVTETNSNISRNYIVVGITHTVTSATATTKLKLIKQ